MAGGMVGPQIWAAGGGGGGGVNPPEAPENQEVEASGSADRMVISGRGRSLGLSLREVVLVEVLLMTALMEERGPWL